MLNKMRAAAANEGFNGVCFTSTWMSDELEHLHRGQSRKRLQVD